MPVGPCTSDGRHGFRWGQSGKCYTGPGAEAKAARQGAAVRAAGWDGHAEGMAFVPGVEIFAAGTHRGESYTGKDLDEIAANFARFLRDGTLQPPVGIGHEDDQRVLEATDLPAAGWVKRVWRQGDKLLADFGEVPPLVADWINRRLYRKVSAELYDEPPEGCGGTGKTLRRVVLLGAELPQVKTLRDLPLAVYADRPSMPVFLRFSEARRLPKTRTLALFSEVSPMDREQMAQLCQQAGYSEEFLKSLDDKQLGALVLECQRMQSGAPPATPGGTASAQTSMSDDDDKGMAAPQTMGEPSGYLAAGPNLGPGSGISGQREPHTMAAGVTGGAQPSQVILKYGELDRRLAAQEKRMAAQERLTETRLRNEQVATVKAFCERVVREGKALPAEVDPGAQAPNLYHRLLRADPVHRVHKFGEKAQPLSELELQMQEVEARDPKILARVFGEKMPQPQPGDNGTISADRRRELLAATPLGQAALRAQAK